MNMFHKELSQSLMSDLMSVPLFHDASLSFILIAPWEISYDWLMEEERIRTLKKMGQADVLGR